MMSDRGEAGYDRACCFAVGVFGVMGGYFVLDVCGRVGWFL